VVVVAVVVEDVPAADRAISRISIPLLRALKISHLVISTPSVYSG
jgi:hypothetical protein